MNAAAKRGVDADAPVAELVAAALDDDIAVVGDLACRLMLVSQKAHEVFGGSGVEIVVADEPREGGGQGHGAKFANHCPDAAAEFQGAPRAVAFPEGHFAGLARSGRDEDAVVGDFVDAPGGGAEDEGLAGTRLEDHLFVELANAQTAALAMGEEDAVEAAVGDGAGVENGEAGCALAGGYDVANAVPGEARAQFGKLVGGVTAAEQIEHAFEGGAGQASEGSGAADDAVKLVD